MPAVANLSPQTPSAKYNIQTVPSGLIFIEIKGNAFLTARGALSRWRIDIPQYDSGNYRDAVDSTFVGRAPIVIQKFTDTPDLSFQIVPITGTGDVIAELGTNALSAPIPDQIATMMQQDDNFSHTPPHNELKTRTLICWSTMADGSGNVVAEVYADRYIGSSLAIPQTNGSVPPAYAGP